MRIVPINGDKSGEYKLDRGVEQGNGIDPLLFINTIDIILMNTRNIASKMIIGT